MNEQKTPTRHKNKVYLVLGSNISPNTNIQKALLLLHEELEICSQSSAWETFPVGVKGNNFVNLAVEIRTIHNLPTLKKQFIRTFEKKLGRIRTGNKFAPRPIDIDISIFNHRVIDQDIWNLAYLAVPLAEILPSFVNPTTGETIKEAAERLAKTTQLKKIHL